MEIVGQIAPIMAPVFQGFIFLINIKTHYNGEQFVGFFALCYTHSQFEGKFTFFWGYRWGFALFPKSIKQLKINLKIRYNIAKVDIKYTLKIHCNIDQDNVKTTVKNRQQK